MPGSCVAVGRYQDTRGYYQGLLEVEAGGWHAVEAPLPPDAARGRNPYVTVEWVTCPFARRCVAVGAYVARDGSRQIFADVLSHGRWRSSRMPLPASAAPEPLAYLGYVTCISPFDCVAVGEFTTSAGARQGLIEREVFGVWLASRAPLPSDAAADPNATINEVSCPTKGFCAATGDYQDRRGGLKAVLETFSNGTWTAVKAPTTDRTGLYMSSVSCPTVNWCVAAGNTDFSGLLETYANGRWTVTDAPLPPRSFHAVFMGNSVSCPAVSDCTVFGSFTKGGTGQGVLETYRRH